MFNNCYVCNINKQDKTTRQPRSPSMNRCFVKMNISAAHNPIVVFTSKCIQHWRYLVDALDMSVCINFTRFVSSTLKQCFRSIPRKGKTTQSYINNTKLRKCQQSDFARRLLEQRRFRWKINFVRGGKWEWYTKCEE